MLIVAATLLELKISPVGKRNRQDQLKEKSSRSPEPKETTRIFPQCGTYGAELDPTSVTSDNCVTS